THYPEDGPSEYSCACKNFGVDERQPRKSHISFRFLPPEWVDFCAARVRWRLLPANCPSQPIGILPGFNVANHFHRMQIDDGNIAVGGTRYKCARAIRLHNDAGCAVSHCDSLNRFSGCGIDDT